MQEITRALWFAAIKQNVRRRMFMRRAVGIHSKRTNAEDTQRYERTYRHETEGESIAT